MKTPPARLFSVGHSNHDLDRFLALLRRAGVTAVADVRSSPFSRRLPHFNAPQLAPALRRAGIDYVFLGDLLGGRPRDQDLYDDVEGQLIVNYERVRATDDFALGLDRLQRGSEKYAIAMMCGEEDPLDCHRGLMIAPALKGRGLQTCHLRRDGVESTAEMEARLLRETKVGEGALGGLFPLSAEDERELLAEAYRVMSRKKAFRVRREEDEGEL
jgi:uncharacterized protein (DUF488 family)